MVGVVANNEESKGEGGDGDGWGSSARKQAQERSLQSPQNCRAVAVARATAPSKYVISKQIKLPHHYLT